VRSYAYSEDPVGVVDCASMLVCTLLACELLGPVIATFGGLFAVMPILSLVQITRVRVGVISKPFLLVSIFKCNTSISPKNTEVKLHQPNQPNQKIGCACFKAAYTSSLNPLLTLTMTCDGQPPPVCTLCLPTLWLTTFSPLDNG
jgi:hypothetical protein